MEITLAMSNGAFITIKFSSIFERAQKIVAAIDLIKISHVQ